MTSEWQSGSRLARPASIRVDGLRDPRTVRPERRPTRMPLCRLRRAVVGHRVKTSTTECSPAQSDRNPFASVGSAVDSESDTQQLMLPIMVPIILPMLFLGRVAQDPNSTFSIITSMIPFFAPMLMPVRVAMTDVPAWEYITAVILMTGTFVGLIWLSSRIYRVGILMYGKNASFKEMAKWIRYN